MQDILKKHQAVKAVDIEGLVKQQIFIDLNLEQLSEYNIAINKLSNLIRARNINIPGGNLELDGIKVPVNISGEYTYVDEIADTIVSVSEQGIPVYLKNIANVHQAEAKKEKLAYYQGHKALLIGVKYMDGINITKAEK